MTEVRYDEPADVELRALIEEETLSPEVRDMMGNTMIAWMQKDFNKRAATAIVTVEKNSKKLENYSELVELQQDLSVALHVMGLVDPNGEKHDSVWRELLDEGRPTSLTARLKQKGSKESASVFLLGAGSANTLHNLGRAVKPDYNPSLAEANPEAWVDSKRKGDLEVYAGEKKGVVYKNIVQIKSDSQGQVGLMEIDDVSRNYYDIKKRDIAELKKYVDELNEKSDGKTVYRGFAALIPSYDSKPIENLYGIITDDRIVDVFKEEAERANYFIGEDDE